MISNNHIKVWLKIVGPPLLAVALSSRCTAQATQPVNGPTTSFDEAKRRLDEMNKRSAEKQDSRIRDQIQETLPDTHFDNIVLGDVINFLHEVSNANISVDWVALKDVGITKDTGVTVAMMKQPTLGLLLSQVLMSVGNQQSLAAFTIRDGTIFVSTQKAIDQINSDMFWAQWQKENPDIPVDVARGKYNQLQQQFSTQFPQTSYDYVRGRTDEAWDSWVAATRTAKGSSQSSGTNR